MDKENSESGLPRETSEPAMPLTMVITDESVPEEPTQQKLTPDEPMHEESV